MTYRRQVATAYPQYQGRWRAAVYLILAFTCSAPEVPATAPVETTDPFARELQALIDLESWDAHAKAVLATEAHPDLAAAWLALASAAGTVEEATTAVTRAAGAPGITDVEQQLVAVRQALLGNDTATAHATAVTLTEGHPERVEAWLTLSRVSSARGDADAARRAAEQALALDADGLSAHVLLGESFTFAEPRDLDKARHHYERATELRPELGATWINLGDVHRAAKDLELAHARYAKAMEVDPRNPIGPIKRGHVNSFLGRGDEARADYEKGMALGTVRDGLELGTFRATVHVHEGDPQAALDELSAILARVEASGLPAPEQRAVRAFVLENMAMVALHLAQPDRAGPIVEALAASLREGPADPASDANATYWEGRLAIVRGDHDAARATAERYAERVGGDPKQLQRYHELLGLSAYRAGALPEAIDHLAKVTLDSGLQAAYTRARALEDSGRIVDARRLYREVADWGFNSVDYALLRKDAAARGGAAE